MRKNLLTLVLLLAALPTLVGCASATPETQCYKSLSVAATAVDTAMNVSGDLYRQGKITEAQKAQILDAYAKYQTAGKAVFFGCKGISDKAASDLLIADISAAAGQVTALVLSFQK